MRRPTIAVGIITRNEEEWLEGCLRSVADWADEIVVIDAFSSDNSFEIAKKYTKKAFQHTWDSFKDQKNRLLEHVTSEWLYACDADERVTREQCTEMLEAVARSDGYVAYEIPTRNVFLGREMHYGGWSPEFHVRLFKMDHFKGWQKDIHEVPSIDGKIGRLQHGFLHFSHRSIAEMLEKTIRYSEVEARWRFDAGYPSVTVWRLIRSMLREFYLRGLNGQAYRDGMVGWIELFYQAFSNFITYARLWELQRGEPLADTYRRLDKEL